jgi:tripartite motif-containing protein 71
MHDTVTRLRRAALGGSALIAVVSGAISGHAGLAQTVRAPAHAATFRAPAALTFDLKRDAYVADSGSARVVKLSPEATVIGQWGTAGGVIGQFGAPAGIAADAFGHVYVSDSRKARVQKFSYAGKSLGKWGLTSLSRPMGLAIDGKGNVFVADSGANHIVKLSPQGLPIATFSDRYVPPPHRVGKKKKLVPSKPVSLGPFSHPAGVYVDYGSRTYVADTGNNRIVKLAQSGKPLRQWNNQNTAGLYLRQPEGVVLDLPGNLWVADTGNSRVVKISPQGKVLLRVTSSGGVHLSHPRGVMVDVKGNIYVADTGNGRIIKLSAAGVSLGTWK